MQILGLWGMYFDAVVAEVKKNLLLFRLAQAILWYLVVAKTTICSNYSFLLRVNDYRKFKDATKVLNFMNLFRD